MRLIGIFGLGRVCHRLLCVLANSLVGHGDALPGSLNLVLDPSPEFRLFAISTAEPSVPG
jgi:hypothetical protein